MATKSEEGPQVYKSINAIQAALAKEGITKSHKNAQQGYSFRGVDDVYNALAPLLAEHRLCILPRMLGRTVTERATKTGGALFYVTVEAEYDFVSSHDGSKHTVKTFGEAMDSADKATNKAMSAAYKYACIQAFSIPTAGDNDADAQTHDVAASAIQAAKKVFTPAAATSGDVQVVRFIPHDIKTGKTKAGAFRLTVKLPDGSDASSLNEDDQVTLSKAKAASAYVRLAYKTNGQFKNIVKIYPDAETVNEPEPAPEPELEEVPF